MDKYFKAVDPDYDLFDSKDEAIKYLLALNDVYAIAVVNPEKDKYWLSDICDRQDVETNLRESGLAPYAQFEGTFSI